MIFSKYVDNILKRMKRVMKTYILIHEEVLKSNRPDQENNVLKQCFLNQYPLEPYGSARGR